MVQADLCFDSHLINELAKFDVRFNRGKTYIENKMFILELNRERGRSWIDINLISVTSFPPEDFLIRKINCLLEMLLSAKYWK